MATRYYNAAVDNTWSNTGNWWTDAGHTIALGGLPANTDSVVLSANLSEPAYAATIVNLTSSYSLNMLLTCSLATINSGSNGGSIIGTAVFNGTTTVGGTIIGDATLNDTANFSGTATGSVIFNDSSIFSLGLITGNVTFNDTAVAGFGDIIGDVVFNGSVDMNELTIIGNCTFNDTSGTLDVANSITGDCTFNDSATNASANIMGDAIFNGTATNESTGVITGDVVFNGTSSNDGTITGNTVFTGSSTNNGTVTGNAAVYHPVAFPISGSISGAIDYFDYTFVSGECLVEHAGTGVAIFAPTVNIPAGTCNIIHTNFCTQIYGTVSVPTGTCNVVFSCSGRVAEPDTGFTVHQAVTEIMSQWGACGGGCSSEKLPEALNILNGCLQEIYINAKDLQYLSNETITVTLTGQDQGLDYFELPDTVQAVVGPVFYTTDGATRIIPGVKTKGQILQYSTLYRTPGKAPLMAYWVESTAQSAGERCNVRLYTPLSSFTGETTASITTDIQREIPRFRESDCRSGTRVPIPHQYAESLLLPLIREKAAASRNASRRDNYQMYQVEANAARSRFGMADPQNPAIDGGTTKP